jgi:hypothetical protein
MHVKPWFFKYSEVSQIPVCQLTIPAEKLKISSKNIDLLTDLCTQFPELVTSWVCGITAAGSVGVQGRDVRLAVYHIDIINNAVNLRIAESHHVRGRRF